MFLDASAIVAILAQEDGWRTLETKLSGSDRNLASALSVWESVSALNRIHASSMDRAALAAKRFMSESRATVVPITPEIGDLAIEASRRFGRGRHKADLNFGDCFSYACARHHNVPLLFKGEDFVHTDIETA